jgi:hypothetical protein
MTAIRPSAHILLDIDKRLDPNDELTAAMKRSYLYIAATRVAFHNEELALAQRQTAQAAKEEEHTEETSAEEVGAEEAEGSTVGGSEAPLNDACNAAGEAASAPGAANNTPTETTNAADEIPYNNVMRLHMHLRKPYWDTSAPEAKDLWDNMMHRWLSNISRKISNTMIAFIMSREKNGGIPIVFSSIEYDFEGCALLEFQLAPDSSITENTVYVIEKIRAWYNSGIAKGSVERVCVPTKEDDPFAYNLSGVQAVFTDGTSRVIPLA